MPFYPQSVTRNSRIYPPFELGTAIHDSRLLLLLLAMMTWTACRSWPPVRKLKTLPVMGVQKYNEKVVFLGKPWAKKTVVVFIRGHW